MNKWLNILLSLAVVVLLAILLIKCNRQQPEQPPQVIAKTDTVYIEKERIVEHTKIKYVTMVDTFYTTETDTVFVQVPITYKQYKDTVTSQQSDTTVIQVDYHGYLAEIDSIRLKNSYSFEIPKPRNKGFTYGIYVTTGVGYNALNNSPYIGISVGYGIGYSWYLQK